MDKRAPTIAPHGMRAPDITGYWHAWRVRRTETNPITLANWLAYCPGLHGVWKYWLVSLVSLRDHPELPPAKRAYPEAQYELMVLALDPRCRPDPDRVHSLAPMLSPDQIEQFHCRSELEAIRFCEHLVRLIVSGHLPPDTDYRQRWTEVVSGFVTRQCEREAVTH